VVKWKFIAACISPSAEPGPILSAAALRYQARIPKVGGTVAYTIPERPQREAQLGIQVCGLPECGAKVRRLNAGQKVTSALSIRTPEQYGTRWRGALSLVLTYEKKRIEARQQANGVWRGSRDPS